MTVIVRKIGGSVAVVIPKAVAREMELREGTALEVTADSTGIILRKRARRPRRPLRELLAGIKPGAYRHRSREFAADRPVGREIW